MNKLLLLAVAGLISITLQSLAATAPELPSTFAYQDSVDKKNGNPKDAFKNLFETETSNGINISKLNPKAVSFVEDYMEIHSTRLNRMKGWGKPYFDMIGDVFTQHGLPVELKYLSVIESDLKTSAVSWAGAVGPWQFMPETARGFGLVVNRKRDDRRDYRKSTHAAAKYLTNLYGIYNDWLLVVAAYNCGAGNVNAAIRKSGSRNFWDMQYYLPTESRNHVKKFIATHYIMEGAGGMTTLTKKETENLSVPAAVTTDPSLSAETISGKYTAQAITGIIQMNITDFNNLNPNFDRTIAANGSYELRLPSEKMTVFQASKPQILEESIKIMLGTAGR